MPHVLSAKPNPARDYDEAVSRAETLMTTDEDVSPLSHARLMTHGYRTPRAIVFFHGASASPAQFERLGQTFHALGYNVLIPRYPHHGLVDRMTDAMKFLRAEMLVRLADEAVDIARGLGERVTVAGLSAGGVLSAWVAAERDDVALAVPISPAFLPGFLSMRAITWLAPVARHLPNLQRWWDPERREASGQPYSYPRFSTRALIEVFWLGAYVYTTAARAKAGRVHFITNPTDPLLDFSPVEVLTDRWRAAGGDVTHFRFPDLPSLHDIIDPMHPDVRIDTIDETLVRLIAEQPETAYDET